ncbi:MAG: hypothetical protein WC760_08310 [Bacteroidia bacterium]|jgi:hypothetical protein
MRNFIFVLLMLCTALQSSAQLSVPYKLDPKPEFKKTLNGLKQDQIEELVVLNETIIEYDYDKEGNLIQFYYSHVVKFVNSIDAIDRNNKIYVSLKSAVGLESFDARVILANGTIKTMGSEALREGTTEEGNKLTFFAISGAEKGSFIEYYYLIRKNPNISGSYISFESKINIAKATVKIISPDNLLFITKSQNGFTELTTDSSIKDKNMLQGTTLNIPGVNEEAFANDGGNSMKVIYQLYYNTSKGKKNPYNYGVVSQSIFESVVNQATKEDLKYIDKILKNSEIKYAPDAESKVRAIENYVKEKYSFTEDNDEKYEKLKTIASNNTLNENGATTLLYLLLTTAGIETELVVTSNRYSLRFDPEFESYCFLNTYLLYVPAFKKFIMPANYTYRFGLTPYGYTQNHGLFIRKVSLGELATGAGKIKPIPSLPSANTQHNIKIKANLDANLDSLEIDFTQELSGYYARSYQPYFEHMPKDKLREFEEEIVKSLHQEITIKSINIENGNAKYLPVKPLIISSKITSQHFVEKAGQKLLIHIGELIGPQAELYQEKNRVLPVENDYNREYHRTITFIVPDGYVVKNAADLNISVQPFKTNGDGAGFVSTVTTSNNTIQVTCDEYYHQINFPLKEYEQYRSVINAAANFNKIVLLLEKKL